MAVAFDTVGEHYTRAISLGTVPDWTVTCWAKLALDRATTTVLWQIDDGASANFLRVNVWNGTAITFQADAGWFGNAGQTMVVGTWYFVAMSATANPGQVRMRIRAADSTTWVGGSPTQVNATFGANTLRIGGTAAAGEWVNGSLTAVKAWDAALTPSEMEQESYSYQPRRTSNLRAWYPLLTPDTTDYSGGGQTLSGGVGAAVDSGPPISWSVGRRRIVIPAAPPPPSGPDFRAASQVASGTAASFNCPKPTVPDPVVEGDVLVAFHAADTGTLANMGTPTGGATWLPLASRARDDGTGAGSKLWWKVAGPSEPTNYGFTQGSNADGAVSIVAVKGASTDTPVVAQTGGTTSGTSKSTPSITGAVGDFEIRGVTLHAPGVAASFTAPAGFTERTDVVSGTYAVTTTATRTLTAAGATGTANFTASASVAEWHGFTVGVTGGVTSKSLADAGSAAESLAVSAAAVLAQSGSAADALSATVSTALADAGSATQALAATAAAALSDTASGADLLSTGVPKAFADGGSATQAIAANAAVPLAQAASAADSLTANVTLTLAQSGSATDALSAGLLLAKTLTDSASATDALSAVISREITGAGAPYMAWAVDAPEVRWAAGSPYSSWAADAPTSAWSASPPSTRYSAGPPALEEVS